MLVLATRCLNEIDVTSCRNFETVHEYELKTACDDLRHSDSESSEKGHADGGMLEVSVRAEGTYTLFA